VNVAEGKIHHHLNYPNQCLQLMVINTLAPELSAHCILQERDLNGLPMAACYWPATVVIMWHSHYTVQWLSSSFCTKGLNMCK